MEVVVPDPHFGNDVRRLIIWIGRRQCGLVLRRLRHGAAPAFQYVQVLARNVRDVVQILLRLVYPEEPLGGAGCKGTTHFFAIKQKQRQLTVDETPFRRNPQRAVGLVLDEFVDDGAHLFQIGYRIDFDRAHGYRWNNSIRTTP